MQRLKRRLEKLEINDDELCELPGGIQLTRKQLNELLKLVAQTSSTLPPCERERPRGG
ncbi:MAG: hypothetical protein ABFS45_21595 [Pseudomonadota bacterium]